jgi:single-stranded-DNA-specific exonuclease
MGSGEQEVAGENRRVIKGSVRSIKGFHVAQALSELSPLLHNHGGHESAGGFSLEFKNLEGFQKAFVDLAAQSLSEDMLKPKLLADTLIDLSAIDFDLVDELSKLAPFGVGNPAPVLVSQGVEILTASQLAAKHLRLRLRQKDAIRDAVAWGMLGNPLCRKGQTVNIAFKPEINTYRGISSVQIQIKEVWQDNING